MEPRRVLLDADAGCGKSTVCQYITYLWTKGELWSEQYKWLFYIKIRELNSLNYPFRSNDYSLVDIIETECFQGYKLNHVEKQKLKYLFENPAKILWILDGCDERTIPDYLKLIGRELFSKPNLLLTSRPYQTHDLNYDMKIKIQKFIDEDIENYIKKYFHNDGNSTTSECWSKICLYEKLKETVQIPACLEIVCNLWEYDENIFKLDMTMGELYQKMCESLLRRYLLKVYNQNTSAIGEKDLYQHPNAEAFLHLVSLAFRATKSHQVTVSGKEIANVAGSPFLCVLQIGLLKTKNKKASRILEQNNYYFIHRSFQEYLCARYMINALSSMYSKKQKKEVIRFIADEKYNRDLQHTFYFFFMLQPSVKCSDRFWSAVDSEPKDLVGIRHCSRISRWFQDGLCGLSEEEKVKMRTIDTVKKWVSNTKRRAHDYGNTYLFEWFADVTDDQCWLEAWMNDLFIDDPSARRYFLPDLWTRENIDALRKIFGSNFK